MPKTNPLKNLGSLDQLADQLADIQVKVGKWGGRKLSLPNARGTFTLYQLTKKVSEIANEYRGNLSTSELQKLRNALNRIENEAAKKGKESNLFQKAMTEIRRLKGPRQEEKLEEKKELKETLDRMDDNLKPEPQFKKELAKKCPKLSQKFMELLSFKERGQLAPINYQSAMWKLKELAPFKMPDDKKIAKEVLIALLDTETEPFELRAMVGLEPRLANYQDFHLHLRRKDPDLGEHFLYLAGREQYEQDELQHAKEMLGQLGNFKLRPQKDAEHFLQKLLNKHSTLEDLKSFVKIDLTNIQ